MSIQPTSVVRRIVEDARANPRADFACEVHEGEAFRATSPRQRITWLRAPAGGFTTQFEFWTHALRVWLEQIGLADRFEAIVGNALCEQVDEVELRAAIEARLAGLRTANRLEFAGPFAAAYLMIAQEVLEAYVVESDSELRAFFWEDLDWL